MARLLAQSDINFTSSSWKTISSTGYLFSESNTTATTTSMVRATASAFSAGVVIEGILLRISSRNAVPTGTFSVELYNSTDSVQEKVVTCNVSDITGGTSALANGWVYFKFGASVTTAAKSYTVGISSSSGGQVTVFRDATAGNWSKGFVTSTTAAPAAGDECYIAGPITGTGSVTSVTVTMDNTASTQFAHVGVCDKGALAWGTTASTNYRLDVTGISWNGTPTANVGLALTGNGTMTVGTSGTRMPSTSTAVINLVSTGTAASGNTFVIRAYSTLKMYGTQRTRAAKAAADFSNGATSITTNISTGWKNGDLIAMGATARSATPSVESKTLTADASGTTLTISAVGTGKSGTSPVQCDLINLTSNVRIYGTSTTQTANIYKSAGLSTVDLDNVEIRYMGSTTGSFRGIDLLGTAAAAGSDVFNMTDCALYDFATALTSIGFNPGATATDFSLTRCVFYGPYFHVNIAAITVGTGTMQLTDCVSIGSNNTFTVSDESVGINGLIVNGSTSSNGASLVLTSCTKTIANISTTVCAVTGLALFLRDVTTVSNLTSYRNNTTGINISSTARAAISTMTIFGNGTNNLSLATSFINDFTIDGADIQSGSGTTCPIGIALTAGSFNNFIFSNSTIGSVTTHSTGDVSVGAVGYGCKIVFRDSTLGSSTQVASQSNLTNPDFIGIQRSGGSSGSNRTYYQAGRLDADGTIYDTSPYSARLTPNSASIKVQTKLFTCNIVSGSTATISIKIRKSVVGDGAAYNGNQPRIIMKANQAAGSSFDSDITAITADNNANGAFYTYTYTTPTATDNTALEFYADCDGTAGWVNFDTVRVS